ncbi:OmpA family protein [Prauserella cavernicola]|uniref:OmpA family protein n=1 Tax=Prauserella cavernicola TaxID=2800127 RepID=A0A934QRE8_9PSEU|nr:OmpA family protein [Prauserella cavernicola]MBK1785316.1 OmpA family protein [Prauserella cavernicola]
MSGDRGRLWLAPLALLVTGVLAFVVTRFETDGIESDLLARSQSALSAVGLSPEAVAFDGRDATVSGVPADEAVWAAEVVGGVEGVRDVVTATPAGQRDAGPADARRQLQEELDALLAQQPVSFQPDSAVLTPEGESSVAAVTALLARTPTDVAFEVRGHVARVPGGDPAGARELSQQRADAVAQRLVGAGIASDRVSAVGFGDTRPLTETGDTSADRRVEISVR